ncbi:MAG: hypothetical protein JJE25_04615 [Bacteroidia bacterium]|nr:hypothetical protein [Bacteroidia bacterium]
MFRIEKKTGIVEGSYTHNIYFKDILFSEQGYYHEGGFCFDDQEVIDIEDFLPLKIAELPEWFNLITFEHQIHKEICLLHIDFLGDKAELDMGIVERDFTSSPWRFSLFKYALIVCIVKMFGSDSSIDDSETSAFFECSVEIQKGDTIRDVYERGQKIAAQLYRATTESLKSQLN